MLSRFLRAALVEMYVQVCLQRRQRRECEYVPVERIVCAEALRSEHILDKYVHTYDKRYPIASRRRSSVRRQRICSLLGCCPVDYVLGHVHTCYVVHSG